MLSLRLVTLLVALAPVALPAAAPSGADWPNFRGPAYSGRTSEEPWKGGALKQLWNRQVGEGFSGVSVVGSRAYTMGWSEGKDHLLCLDAASGRQVWRYSYACPRGDSYTGSRATPSVRAGRVYSISRAGQAYCLNATNGRLIWSTNLQRETGAELPQWGFGTSALLHGDLVIYGVGTAGAALDARTGRLVWKSGGGKAGYATPVPYRAPGLAPGVAIFTTSAVVGVVPATGRPAWRYPWQTRFDINAADPVFNGNRVFISSNYGRGGAVIELKGSRAAKVWENRNMRNHFHASIWIGDYLYGNDENTLRCIDARTGATQWSERGMGKGGLIATGGNLLVLTERGELMLVQATPQKFIKLGSHQLPRGEYWTSPTAAGGRIFGRSHEGALTCLAPAR